MRRISETWMSRSAINCRPMIQLGKQRVVVNIRCVSTCCSMDDRYIHVYMSMLVEDGRKGSFAAESADPGISFFVCTKITRDER